MATKKSEEEAPSDQIPQPRETETDIDSSPTVGHVPGADVQPFEDN